MTGNQLKTQFDFEAGLEAGNKIQVRWTNNYNFYIAEAYVKTLNKSSVTVNLAHELLGYPEGWKINVPRVSVLAQWSNNNGAFRIS